MSNWHEWRRQGVGSSDAPIVLGISPYKSPRMLFEEKIGLVTPDLSGSYVTDLGHKYEECMRAQVEIENGCDFPPTLVEHETFPYIRASLDGYDKEKNIFVEIKMIGAEALEQLMLLERPCAPHYAQVQHQFLVTGAEKALYAAYTLNAEANQIDRTFVIEMRPDLDFIRELKTKIDEFWQCVQTQTPPALTHKDRVLVEDEELIKLARKYVRAKRLSDNLKDFLESAKEKFLSASEHSNFSIGPVNVVRLEKYKRVTIKE